jgi:hypothetical protein
MKTAAIKNRITANTEALTATATMAEAYYKAKAKADERKKAKEAEKAEKEAQEAQPEATSIVVDEELDDMPALENGSGDERSDSE